jgi:hypothetical protein
MDYAGINDTSGVSAPLRRGEEEKRIFEKFMLQAAKKEDSGVMTHAGINEKEKER